MLINTYLIIKEKKLKIKVKKPNGQNRGRDFLAFINHVTQGSSRKRNGKVNIDGRKKVL